MLALLLCLSATLQAAGTTVLFRPGSPDTGPFPTDLLTVADRRQVTGVRVNLPLPDCAQQPSSCQEIRLLNQLDGFSLQPRIAVRFSAPVNTSTLRDGIFLVWLDKPANEQPGVKPRGSISRINEVIYEPATNTAFAESDDMLDQHRVYALVVTDGVRDEAGDPVEPDPAFVSCVGQPPPNAYCGRLAEELETISEAGRTVAASLFTTIAATSYLEKARAALELAPLDFRRTGARSVFTVGEILAVILRQQAGVNPPRFEDFTVPLPSIVLEQVGLIAFGSYRSPYFLNASQIIPTAPSGDPVGLPAESKDVYFHAFLPESQRPPGGYPAIIFGHGLNDSRFGAPTLVAGSFAEQGFATVAINAAGHGLGPEGTLRIIDDSFRVTELPAGGRGVDIDGDGQLTSREGCLVLNPTPVGLRDCVRQTAVDLLQLVRLIRTGVDLDGDGAVDLDPNRIYYAGQSLGAIYGTALHALAPEVRAAAFNVGGGTVVDIARTSPSFRFIARDFLAGRNPPLLNRDGDFDDDFPLRDQPVRRNQVTGAMEIQDVLERLEWFQMSGDPLAFAPHIGASPPAGALAKPALWQFARGDRTVPNSATSNLIRAAEMRSSAVLYRHDLARDVFPNLPENPHSYLVDVRSPGRLAVALAAQHQIAGFFDSDGASIPDVNPRVRPLFGRELFFVPVTLPDDLGFGSGPLSAASVSAASFAAGALAADSIAAAFGQELATGTRSAAELPLPTSLAGTTVSLTDSTGTTRPAPIFFVSPEQVNYLLPAGTAEGTAEVAITNLDGVVSAGTVRIERVAPGVFTANQSGMGVPAALVVRARPAGPLEISNAFRCGQGPGSCVAEPIDLGPESQEVFLILFGTGIRGAASPGDVSVRVGGVAAEVTFAGPQSQFAGLDQVNVRLPRALAGRGEVELNLGVSGRVANAVVVNIR